MAQTNNLCDRVEEALLTYFRSLTDAERGGVTSNKVLASFEDTTATKAYPMIACECEALGFEPQQKGNWRGTARVYVRSKCDPEEPGGTTRDDHRTLVGVIFDLVTNDGFMPALKAAVPNFTVFELNIRAQGKAVNVQARLFQNWIEFELEVCGSDID